MPLDTLENLCYTYLRSSTDEGTMSGKLTAAEAAKELGYHLNYLYALLKDQTIKGEKWGGRIWMIDRREVERIKAAQDDHGRLTK